MAITGRSPNRADFERLLERAVPHKKRLIRALPYDCPNCYVDGQLSIALTCATCNGTGYIGMARGASLNAPPAAKIFLFFADVQLGHGLLGSGGDSVRIMEDLGKQNIGDGILFCKITNIDVLTGESFYPKVDQSLERPDRIIDIDGKVYSVTKEIVGNFGDELVFRQFTIEIGTQGAK